MKILKWGTAWDLFHGTGKNKARLKIHFIKKAKIRHSWGFISYKMIQ